MTTAPPQPRARSQEAPEVARTDRAGIVHVTTVPATLSFLSGQASFMRRAGFSVHAISSPGPAFGATLSAFGDQEDIPVHAVGMARKISPLADLFALWRLWRVLARVHPAVVDAHTPKAGLLGMLAASLARTPVRVYHMHGLPFVSASGWRRHLLRWTERMSCRLAHRVLAVSHSIRTLAVSEGLCSADKIAVLLSGSVNAVDADRFKPLDGPTHGAARTELGIPADALVIGFVGRIARDKGIVELAGAWQRLRDDRRLHLLIVGPEDATDAVPAEVMSGLRADPRVHLTGLDPDTPRRYAAMDVLALPTYREGFPQVVLEAAAMRVPVVATSVPGCVDAVDDGATGTLVPARNVGALAAALRRYLSDPSLRVTHGEAARCRVLGEFRQDRVWEALAAEYRRLLAVRAGL